MLLGDFCNTSVFYTDYTGDLLFHITIADKNQISFMLSQDNQVTTCTNLFSQLCSTINL